MARRLGSTHNELTITDQLSDSAIVLQYRMPSNKERIKYQQSLVNVRGARLRVNSFETRLQFGMVILTGFRDGDFEIEREGAWKPISSNPGSPDYLPGWREFVEESAPDIVVALAATVFEGATAQPAEDMEETAIDGDLPSPKNSRPSSIGTLIASE